MWRQWPAIIMHKSLETVGSDVTNVIVDWVLLSSQQKKVLTI